MFTRPGNIEIYCWDFLLDFNFANISKITGGIIMYRTLLCNDIRDKHIGQTVQLAGWVDVVRDHGGIIFVDIRDYTGVTQVVVHNEE